MQTYTTEEIRNGSFHLAVDMVERAIGKRNDRLNKEGSRDPTRMMWLTASDFGVEMLSQDEMRRRQDQASLLPCR